MTRNDYRIGLRIIGILFLVMLIRTHNIVHLWDMDKIAHPFIVTSVFFRSLVICFYVLNAAAAIGLILGRPFGVVLGAIAIIFTTFFFAAPYVPYLAETLFPPAYKMIANIVMNVILMVVMIVVRTRPRTLSVGAESPAGS